MTAPHVFEQIANRTSKTEFWTGWNAKHRQNLAIWFIRYNIERDPSYGCYWWY